MTNVQQQSTSSSGAYRPTRAGPSEPTTWAWFAAIMIAIVGIWNLIDGIIGLTDAHYYASVAASNGVHLPVTDTIRTWGWIALIMGAVMITAAIGIVGGFLWARVIGVILVGLNMVFQLAFLPAYPFWGLVILAVDTLIIYGLVVHVGRRNGRPVSNGRPG